MTYERRPKLAADAIDLSDLPPAQAAFVKKLVPHFGKVDENNVWSGVHGFIVSFDGDNPRLPKEVLSILTKERSFRWIEVNGRKITVGM